MADSKKPVEVIFAPGAFDDLDVESQEELDAIMAEIQNHFANLTPEDLEAQSRPIDWDNLDDEDRAILARAINNEPRNLQ